MDSTALGSVCVCTCGAMPFYAPGFDPVLIVSQIVCMQARPRKPCTAPAIHSPKLYHPQHYPCAEILCLLSA